MSDEESPAKAEGQAEPDIPSNTPGWGVLQSILSLIMTKEQPNKAPDEYLPDGAVRRTSIFSSFLPASSTSGREIAQDEASDNTKGQVLSKFNGTISVVKNLLTGQDEQVVVGSGQDFNSNSEAEARYSFETMLLVLVVVRNGNRFCVTEDLEGWYLPAGKVYYGESFHDAARRCAIETAGIEVNLTGLLRFEYKLEDGIIVFKCIFEAVPVEKNAPLKKQMLQIERISKDVETMSLGSNATNYILRAEWMEFKEFEKISCKTRNKRSKKILKNLRKQTSGKLKRGSFTSGMSMAEVDGLRLSNNVSAGNGGGSVITSLHEFGGKKAKSREAIGILKWSQQRSVNIVHPKIFNSISGAIDENQFFSSTCVRIQVMLRTRESHRFLLLHKGMRNVKVKNLRKLKFKSQKGKTEDYCDIPSEILMIAVPLEEVANDIMLDFDNIFEINLREKRKLDMIEKKKKKKNVSAEETNKTRLKSLKSLRHHTPKMSRKKKSEADVGARLIGICGIKHEAPQKVSLKSKGSFTITYLAEVQEDFSKIVVKDRWRWLSFDDLMETYNHVYRYSKTADENFDRFEQLVNLARNCQEEIIAPLDFVGKDGSKLTR